MRDAIDTSDVLEDYAPKTKKAKSRWDMKSEWLLLGREMNDDIILLLKNLPKGI